MSADSNYSQQPVPLAARKSALALSVVMLGLTFFSASMWTGGTLGTGLSYDDFFLAVLLGNLMLGLYTAILGFIGARTGLSTRTRSISARAWAISSVSWYKGVRSSKIQNDRPWVATTKSWSLITRS